MNLSAAENRQRLHLEGKDFMQVGNYFSALELFLNALHQYGPHVGLLSDIAATYYMMGRKEDCHKMTLRLLHELDVAEELLSTESFIRTHIYLGKLLEESAEVDKALISYEKAVVAAGDFPELRLKAQAQLLRLKSFLGVSVGLAELYRWLVTSPVGSAAIAEEIEHGLMLAEMTLFGLEFAEARLRGIFSRSETPSWFLRLVLVDFIEECLRQNFYVTDFSAMMKRVVLVDADVFERKVLDLSQNPDAPVDLGEIHQLCLEIPMMGSLRILGLLVARKNHAESGRKLEMLVGALAPQAQKILLKKWMPHEALLPKTLYFSVTQQSLFVKGQELRIKKDSFTHRCLEIFTTTESCDIEAFVAQVFGSEYNPSYHDRTRIALQRLNRELRVLTSLPQSFVLRKNRVELNAALSLKLG